MSTNTWFPQDGQLDIIRASDWITVSFNYFHDHWKSSLIGNDATFRELEPLYVISEPPISYHSSNLLTPRWQQGSTRALEVRYLLVDFIIWSLVY
jgi:hypothetical protein